MRMKERANIGCRDSISAKARSFLSDTARIFQKPFSGLGIIVWFFFVFSYMALPGNPTWRGDLPDPDNFTYLTQTIDWLQGQGWFDNIQHRMNPPEGVAIHYTRLAELPIAAIISIFRFFNYSWNGAALLTSFVLPLIYLGVFFWVLKKVASVFVGEDWSGLSMWLALFAPALLHKFAPGQVDHHAIEAIMTIGSIGLMCACFKDPQKWKLAALSGFLMATAVSIALEVLPWMVLISFITGLWCVVEGKKARQAATTFSVTLFLSGSSLLLLIRPLSDIFNMDLLAYSAAYVVLEAFICLAIIVAAGVSERKISTRFVVAGISALLLGISYLNIFPAMMLGPYGAMDPVLAKIFFANLEEAESLINKHGIVSIVLQTALPFLALYSCVVHALNTSKKARLGWGLLGICLLASISLSLFYQIRISIYAQLFAIVPLVALTKSAWEKIAKKHEGRDKFWAEIFLILAIGPATVVLLPALLDGRSFNTGVLLFPARKTAESCDTTGIEKILSAPSYADRRLRIMNMMGQGPEFLFYTKHEVLSAPYHTNINGNMDSFEFFSTPNSETAKEIAIRRKIDMVILCKRVPDMYLSGNGPHYTVSKDGTIRMMPNESFAGKLAIRETPDWLQEMSLPTHVQYRIFEVK